MVLVCLFPVAYSSQVDLIFTVIKTPSADTEAAFFSLSC